MCATCGCGTDEVRITRIDAHDHPHDHPHDHGHDHEAAPDRAHTLDLEVAVLAKNDALAADNRAWLTERGITALNLMSSPGAGKTTLLERTIRETGRPVTVIEGDQETAFDAERIRRAGARAVQVNTGSGCHLDATMVRRALDQLQPADGRLLVIENVGNLVCPALFDLGEHAKVVVVSVTEGDDKPLKYPHMFAAADVVVLNKTDLLPYVGIELVERDLPVPQAVRDACGLLGLDPLQVANEGKLIAIAADDDADAVLEAMQRHPLGTAARQIGTCVTEHPRMVVARTGLGGTRVVDLPIGEQLPRIC